MKCPRAIGGCGNEVALLFRSGLCQTCDAVKAAGEPGAAPAKPNLRAAPPEPTLREPAAPAAPQKQEHRRPIKRRGPGRPPNPDKAEKPPRRAYRRRAVEPASAIPAPAMDSRSMIDKLRGEYQQQHDAAMQTMVALEARLEVLDEIEQRLKSGV